MANEQTYTYNIVGSFTAQDEEVVLWDSTQHSADLNGKFVSVVMQLSCVANNTSSFMGSYLMVLECTTGGILSTPVTIEIDKKTVGALQINPKDEFAKILPAKSLADNGNCNLQLKIKKQKAAFSKGVSGQLRGYIKCTVTPEEDKNSETTVALDKNAITDWFKTLSVDGIKSGKAITNQYTAQKEFKSGSRQIVVWTNENNDDLKIDEISISLTGSVINEVSSQRVIDVDIVATYGEDEFTDNMTMEIVPASSTRTFNVTGKYTKDDLPNDGWCKVDIIAKNTDNLYGEFIGNVIIDGTTVSSAETEEYTDDSDIQSILDNLFSEGYSVGGSTNGSGSGTDSFMNAYSGQGYDDDSALINADYYKTMGMTDDIAAHLQQLEARITALENRMTELDVGGSDIDWYDGGYTGSDDTWGIGDWYEQTDERVSQVEGTDEISGDESCFILYNPTPVNKSHWSGGQAIPKGRIQYLQEFYYFNPVEQGKMFKSFNYDVMWSFNGKNRTCNALLHELADSQFNFLLVFNTGDEDDEYNTEVVFDKVSAGGEDKWNFIEYFEKTQTYKGFFDSSKMKNTDGKDYVKGYFSISRDVDTEEDYDLYLREIQDCINQINQLGQQGQPFVKLTYSMNYKLQDIVSQEDKVKESNNTDVDIDVVNFTGEQNIFSYSAQSNNTNLQSIDFSLTLGYTYDTTQSQVCVGQKVKMYFRTIANHGGFADEITEFPLGEFEITADSPTKQYVIKDKYTTRSFANNGNCTAYVVFATPNITQAKLADFKQYFSGNVKGNINYKAVAK